MPRVKVSYRISETAPKSESTYRATRTAPPAAAGRSWGSVTRQNVRSGPRPRERAASSWAGSVRRSAAATGRWTYGKLTRVRERAEPVNPVSSGTADSQAKAAT